MEKMRLNLDDLRVESFDVDARSAEAGTVRGHAGTDEYTCKHTCDNATCETFVCPCVVTRDRSDCICPTPTP